MTSEPLPAPIVSDEPPRRSRALSSIIEIATTIALAIILYFVIQTFVVQTFRVEGKSMMDSLLDGQHLLIDKLTPRFDDYSRGDVVVLHPPAAYDTVGTPFIKRVIGVPGDHIELKDDAVWVNGVKLDEPYVHYPTKPSEWTVFDVGPGELIVMGDHRNASEDSRVFGAVPVGNIIGRAVLRFWPLDSLGILQTPTYPDTPAAPAS